MMKIVPVILSGGSGTRLWPLSRAARPKQLLALTGDQSMLQLTARRVSRSSLFSAPIVVASGRHADQIEAQLAEAAVPPSTLILEPSARNTAPAIALAALAAGPDHLLLVMPSDHFIRDEAALVAAVELARPLASEGWLVTFGIAPDRPETGYGYIRRGECLQPGVFAVDAFVEKPDAATAQRYCADGGYDWNGGIFLFRAGAFLDALRQHAPDILQAATRAFERSAREGSRLLPEPSSFGASPSQSIDYAVMEKAERIAVVPVDIGWSDVGSWDALYDLGAKDTEGLLAEGEVIAPGSSNCLMRSEGPVVVAPGVHDLIVIATGDAVLILPRGESQRISQAVNILKEREHPALDR